jgi:glycine/D-amino acid oxidase-like deaminating enzyme
VGRSSAHASTIDVSRHLPSLDMVRRIAVVGAGIVGVAIAERLSVRTGCDVTVFEQGPRGRLQGSTAHAPGFVGVLGPDTTMTKLALDSAAVYGKLSYRGSGGFVSVGALELAASAPGAEALSRRAEAAAEAGIPASLIHPGDAARRAPRLVDPTRVEVALHLPSDGAAHAGTIVTALGRRAAAAGVRFQFRAKVTGIELRGERVVAVRTARETFRTDDVVIACGIWGRSVAALAGVDLPQFSVGHPYVRSVPRARAHPPSPLVRWSEHRVYARDHGNHDGLGTSDHHPRLFEDGPDRAELAWPGGSLDRVVAAALALLPPRHRWSPAKRLYGALSITPDGLPLLGALGEIGGLWAAQAIWVTHAAGAARALVAEMFDESTAIGQLAPDRFANEPPEVLHVRAASAYRRAPLQRLSGTPENLAELREIYPHPPGSISR